LCLFFVCEIMPIIVLLDYSYFNLTGLEQVEIRWAEEEDHSAPQPVMMDPLLTSETVPPTRAVRWFDEFDHHHPNESGNDNVSGQSHQAENGTADR
jgi:hypothetical protein